MKKTIALILCLALLLCAGALAETAGKESLGTLNVNGAFDIRCRLPEGYRMTILGSDSAVISALVFSDDGTKPTITLTIAFNESYTENGTAMRLNDVPEDVLALIRESFLENAPGAVIEERETAFGTKLLVVKGFLGAMNFVDFYSIYQSYEVEVLVTAGQEAEDKTLTEEQIQMIVDFLSDMDFVAAE